MSENPNQQNTPNAPGGAKLGTLHTDAPAASTTRTNEYSNPSQTRAGTAKMKFAPKIQPRKKPTEVKQEPAEGTSARGRGRGRGRGEASRGRGRGRGEVQMTASGPFAMGPSKNAGMGRARTSQASGITVGGNRQAMQRDSAQLTGGKPSRLAGDRGATVKDDPEQYSEDEDEGMEIIDIQEVATLDQNAPTSIPREHYKYENKKDKKKKDVKKDVKPKVKAEPKDGNEKVQEDEDDDMEQADVDDIATGGLDLSASEEEDETEDVAHDFTAGLEADEEKMLFFQFPKTFPRFAAPLKQANTDKRVSFADAGEDDNEKDADKEGDEDKDTKGKKEEEDKKPDIKPDLSKIDQLDQDDDAEGEIGELLVYGDGQVRVHLGNGQVYDLNRATQPSFLQNIVSVDHHHRQISVFGEVGLRYSAIPDIDRLINQMGLEDQEEAEIQTVADAAKRGA